MHTLHVVAKCISVHLDMKKLMNFEYMGGKFEPDLLKIRRNLTKFINAFGGPLNFSAFLSQCRSIRTIHRYSYTVVDKPCY